MLIQLNNIHKTFKAKHGAASVEVLKGIDLQIEKGEMVAIKGPSGAGKSTLLHILGCLDQPSSGSYRLDNMDVLRESSIKLSQIRNQRFGFIMQHFALVENDTVIQNVSIPLLFCKTPFSLMDAYAINQLELVGISHLAKKKVSKLSGGEKQRVAISRALVNNPDIILADEPTGALDSENAKMIMNIFKKLNEQGKTIIIVTHEDFVANMCDRIITISDGKII